MPPKSSYRGGHGTGHVQDDDSAGYFPEASTDMPDPSAVQTTASPTSAAPQSRNPPSSSSQGQLSRGSRGRGQQYQGSGSRSRGSRWQPGFSRGSEQPSQSTFLAGTSQALSGPQAQSAQSQSERTDPQPSTHHHQSQDQSGYLPPAQEPSASKKRKNKKSRQRKRRQSFAAPSDTTETGNAFPEHSDLPSVPESQQAAAFYRLGNQDIGSDTSLDSEVLLDHRAQDQNLNRLRRPSTQQNTISQTPRQASLTTSRSGTRISKTTIEPRSSGLSLKEAENGANLPGDEEEEGEEEGLVETERTPLISRHRSTTSKSKSQSHAAQEGSSEARTARSSRRRKKSPSSSISSRRKSTAPRPKSPSLYDEYDVNNPPSRPGSPRLELRDDYDDVLLPDYSESHGSRRFMSSPHGREAIIDIDYNPTEEPDDPRSPETGYLAPPRRRTTETSPVEDVCIPFEQMTEIGEEDDSMQQHEDAVKYRRRKRVWPDLSALEEWAHEEKEVFSQEGVRAKKVDEPVLIGGRLRPQKGTWRREAEEAPFRWTYFNEEMDTSLRSHTISGLQQLGHSFRELFIPDPPELEEPPSDDEDEFVGSILSPERAETPDNGRGSRVVTRQSSLLDPRPSDAKLSSGRNTPSKQGNLDGTSPKRYGPRPVFWLDVLQPTWEEMRVLSRAFGIHKLTAEDIMEQEAREKVELFRTYYFVNYRTFEQDDKSEDYMDPVNMYFLVFKGGVISFHFSQMPHPPNVRRRIRQLAEHQYTDSDWIAYAIIDNITDAYAPVIEQIEQEVDDIDDEILQLNSRDQASDDQKRTKSSSRSIKDAYNYEKVPENEEPTPDRDRNMLLRVGECRKRVMSLYRLLGNKADVIKGLAKRCNEQWEVAPRSDVGLYLGDIQDHLVTMSSNLTHYENILSRAHSNYLAQINIGMNERAEKTADVLGKLTVLGTIVLPMNVVTGLWGMNCLVPGQVEDNPTLYWFFGLTAFLFMFGFSSFFITKRIYGIV